MMSDVEEAPRLITGDYGRHRRQRVKNISRSHFGFVFEKNQMVISTPSFSNSPFFKMFFSRKKTGSRDGAVVRALVSHRCGPGSIPGPGVIYMWVEFVVGSRPCFKGFSPGSLVFLIRIVVQERYQDIILVRMETFYLSTCISALLVFEFLIAFLNVCIFPNHVKSMKFYYYDYYYYYYYDYYYHYY